MLIPKSLLLLLIESRGYGATPGSLDLPPHYYVILELCTCTVFTLPHRLVFVHKTDLDISRSSQVSDLVVSAYFAAYLVGLRPTRSQRKAKVVV